MKLQWGDFVHCHWEALQPLKKKGRDWIWLGGGGGVDDVLHSCFMSRQRVSILRLKKRENTQTKTTTYFKKVLRTPSR